MTDASPDPAGVAGFGVTLVPVVVVSSSVAHTSMDRMPPMSENRAMSAQAVSEELAHPHVGAVSLAASSR